MSVTPCSPVGCLFNGRKSERAPRDTQKRKRQRKRMLPLFIQVKDVQLENPDSDLKKHLSPDFSTELKKPSYLITLEEPIYSLFIEPL